MEHRQPSWRPDLPPESDRPASTNLEITILTPGKSAAQPITELRIECGTRTAWVFDDGTPHIVTRAGITPRQKDRHRGAWMVPLAVLWDVVAYAEKAQRRTVHLVEVSR